MYVAWGIAAVIVNMPEFLAESGHDFGDFFQMLVPPVALAAALGATFFPRWGRMEMFAASALATLVVIFLIISVINAINHPELPRMWVNLILNTSPIVVPSMRAGFIFRTLVWEAYTTRSR
jgi:Co/Zn/Cd efflux system component